MALTPELRATQARILAAAAGADVRVTQASVMVAMQYPAEEVQVRQARVMAATASANDVTVTQARVLVAIKAEEPCVAGHDSNDPHNASIRIVFQGVRR